MRSSRIAALLLALALATNVAHAGIGDMIKNKVKAVKGESKPKPAARAESGAITSRMSPPVTSESLAKFAAALQIEAAERARAVKFLATVKTREAYAKCQQEVMMSAEGQKLSERMLGIGDKASQAEIQKHMTQIGEELQRLTESKCGPDPNEYNDGRRAQMMREALARGSDAFVKDDNAYFIWKEWVLEFCKYIEKLKEQPDAEKQLAKIRDEGLRIPGTGTGIYYVYTATEAKELLERCDELVPLIEAVQ